MAFRLAGADVVVVGAGTGGLTAALVLADAGAQVTLLERVAEPAAVGAGILLQPNGLAVLAALGMGDALRAAGHVLSGAPIRSARGARLLTVGVPAYGSGLDHLLAIRRSRLNEILLDAVAKRPAVVARYGVEVRAADPAGSVDLSSPDGTVAADLVVGADGLHSVVRAGGDFGARTRPAGGPYLRALIASGPGEVEVAGEYWTPLGLFGGARVDPQTVYFYADAGAPSVAAPLTAGDLPALADAWAAALPLAGTVLRRVDRFDRLLVNDVVRVDCATWYDGRLVLLGDAAHAMAPNLGQGANSAIVDAAVLALELGAGRPLADALAAYTRRRRPAVRRVQDGADRAAALAGIRHPVLRSARDGAVWVLGRLPGAGTRLARSAMQEDPAKLHRALVGQIAGR